MIRLISYMRPLLEDEDRWLFHLIHKTNTENPTERGNKEQDKMSGRNFNKMERIIYLIKSLK